MDGKGGREGDRGKGGDPVKGEGGEGKGGEGGEGRRRGEEGKGR